MIDWVSVKDGLPPEGKTREGCSDLVLVYNEYYDSIEECFYNYEMKEWIMSAQEYITHWAVRNKPEIPNEN